MVSELVTRVLAGDRRALARLFTLLERGGDGLAAVVSAVHPHTGRAYCIGFTGPPGAGKSTLVDSLLGVLRRRGMTVGVLAVDPSSPFTGGALLGDRIRMQRHYLDRDVFIRSLATRGVHGGLSRVTSAAVKVLDAFGKDLVIVESAGVGQTELDIMKVADTVVVVLVPEGGDSVQTMKAGLMEIGDIFVVNKADRDGADRFAQAVRSAIALKPGEGRWTPPVLLTRATQDEGTEALLEAIEAHRRAMEETSQLEQRRRLRRQQEFREALRDALEVRLSVLLEQDSRFAGLAASVEAGEEDPYAAAREALRHWALPAGPGPATEAAIGPKGEACSSE